MIGSKAIVFTLRGIERRGISPQIADLIPHDSPRPFQLPKFRVIPMPTEPMWVFIYLFI